MEQNKKQGKTKPSRTEYNITEKNRNITEENKSNTLVKTE